MKENVMQIVREMQTGSLPGPELGEKEYFVIQELCGADDPAELTDLYMALGASGTVLAIPALCAHLETANAETLALVKTAIRLIKARAKARGSILPDAFYTPEHLRPRWKGSMSAFLSYVQVIADIYVKQEHDENEVNRIGEILAAEMNIDMSPYRTFADFKICQTGWDFEGYYQVVMDRMAQEQILADVEDAGVTESHVSLLTGVLMDLQYDYIIARLKLKGNLEYYRFVLKIAECLNVRE